jgi:hypothetical protein
MTSNATGEFANRFWAKVQRSEGCWLWTALRDTNGYGVFKLAGKLPRAHRISYEMHNGEIPVGLVVRHTCDNRACVNPAHLVLGTVADNNRDRAQRSPKPPAQLRHREPGTLEERFWAKVNKSGECWEWLGTKNPGGYGCFKVNYKMRKAHRVAYELGHGSIPADLCVLHRCDNPGCVRPDHLFLGTRSENMQDMQKKGRGRGGDGSNAPSGDDHWSRRRPELVARGDRHGSRLHPERHCRGDAHWAHQFPEKRATGSRHGSKTHPEAVLQGEACPWAKLTDEQVSAIRDEYAAGPLSQEKLGKKYGVSQAQVSRIVHGMRRSVG